MSNSWFQFKEFRINQGQCAMKVTTDACILGAWTPINQAFKNVLDIGAGTGLLSLMLAQRNQNINIDAIELDPTAALQASQNFKDSPWATRIKCCVADIRQHEASAKYDLIICNPPFFSNSLLGPTPTKNYARHDVSLTSHQLFTKARSMLTQEGYLSLLLPYKEYLQWRQNSIESGLYESQCLYIKHTPVSPVKRVVTILSTTQKSSPNITELVIKDYDGNYTNYFKELLSGYYLNL